MPRPMPAGTTTPTPVHGGRIDGARRRPDTGLVSSGEVPVTIGASPAAISWSVDLRRRRGRGGAVDRPPARSRRARRHRRLGTSRDERGGTGSAARCADWIAQPRRVRDRIRTLAGEIVQMSAGDTLRQVMTLGSVQQLTTVRTAAVRRMEEVQRRQEVGFGYVMTARGSPTFHRCARRCRRCLRCAWAGRAS